jgi:predicted HAD superfamily Cof-like phosphohydrolase
MYEDPSNFDDVGEFHKRFDLPAWNYGPREWDQDLINFRIKFLSEELREFEDAAEVHDHAGMADALIDLVYVALGSAHMLGYPWQELWNEVQVANMRKVRAATDGSDSVRHSRWDVVKPPGWKAPDIRCVLKEYGFE